MTVVCPSAPFSRSYIVGRDNKRTNNRTMMPALNAAAGHQGPVKIKLLKGVGVLEIGDPPK